jgi:anti-anti-sigma regulatory factor
LRERSGNNILRIEKVGEDVATVTLRLEGRVVAQWVASLEDECQRVLRKSKRLVLDVAGVTFIDRNGVAMLRKMNGGRVQVVNCSPFLRALLRRPEGS